MSGGARGWAMLRRRVADEEYRALRALLASPTGAGEQARIVLAVLEGARTAELARRENVPRTTVYSWVRPFALYGVAGLDGRRRAGQRPGGLSARCDGAHDTARSSVTLAVGAAHEPGARDEPVGAVRASGPQGSGR